MLRECDGGPAYAQTAVGIPHLEKQGSATQLIVDGKPFLALTGELGNNTASSLENMQPIWSKLEPVISTACWRRYRGPRWSRKKATSNSRW
jgi:hypothetical protein